MWHTTRPFFAVPIRVFRPRPDDTRRASGEGLDGSDPHFLTAGAVSRWGGCGTRCGTWCGTPTPPSGGGRSRPYVSLREGSPARTRAGRSATPIGPMRDALLRAFLVIGGISAACAWTWPGVFHEADPVAVLVRDHTPNVYAAVGRLVRRRARRGRVHCRPISHQPVADLVRPDGRQSRAPVQPSRVATFAYGDRLWDRRRGGPSPGQSHREPDPEWLTIPAHGLSPGVAMFGAVSSGKTSACLHPFARQLLSWHADNPAQRPAALVLESKAIRATTSAGC